MNIQYMSFKILWVEALLSAYGAYMWTIFWCSMYVLFVMSCRSC